MRETHQGIKNLGWPTMSYGPGDYGYGEGRRSGSGRSVGLGPLPRGLEWGGILRSG